MTGHGSAIGFEIELHDQARWRKLAGRDGVLAAEGHCMFLPASALWRGADGAFHDEEIFVGAACEDEVDVAA